MCSICFWWHRQLSPEKTSNKVHQTNWFSWFTLLGLCGVCRTKWMPNIEGDAHRCLSPLQSKLSLSLSIRYIGAYKCISMCVWKFVLWIVYMDISIYYPLFSLLLGFLFCGVLAYQYEIYMFWYGWDSRLCDIDHRHTFTSINVIAGLCSVTSVPWYDLQMNAFTFDASINESSNQQSQVFFFAEFLVLLQVGQSLAGNRWQLLSVGKFEKQNALKWPANILQNKSAIRKKSCKK